MTDSATHPGMKGACLCGAVCVEATKRGDAGACHCEKCRRWTGGPFMTVSGGAAVVFEGAEHIQTYRSSDWAERAFCRICGSSLYYRLLPGQQFAPDGEYILAAGLFDDQSGFALDHEVFVDGAPGWYRFEGERKRMTEAEILQSVGVQETS